ncbi:MAG: hypothetical protein F6J97_05435 [Leptolyngbya sp. SIO4C1]|nr:hypothetical protein [Leptolyngbya sp. SIO4C1]
MLTPLPTADGSSTFFSAEFGEWFHSRQGAYTEAQQTYAVVTQLAQRSQTASELVLLDVCYGLGFNTAAALTAIWQANPDCRVVLRALEIDAQVPRDAIAASLIIHWPPPVQTVLAALATEHRCNTPLLEAQLIIGDARQTIQPLAASYQADAIFLDPFSPPRCPQLWTVEFIQQVARCLKPAGRLATYSCAAAVRTALLQAGLRIGSTPAAGRRWPGTVASYAAEPLPPLSQQEQEHLKTRAAVPYRDPTLSAPAAEIVAARQQVQQQSALEPTGRWRRRWL